MPNVFRNRKNVRIAKKGKSQVITSSPVKKMLEQAAASKQTKEEKRQKRKNQDDGKKKTKFRREAVKTQRAVKKEVRVCIVENV